MSIRCKLGLHQRTLMGFDGFGIALFWCSRCKSAVMHR